MEDLENFNREDLFYQKLFKDNYYLIDYIGLYPDEDKIVSFSDWLKSLNLPTTTLPHITICYSKTSINNYIFNNEVKYGNSYTEILKYPISINKDKVKFDFLIDPKGIKHLILNIEDKKVITSLNSMENYYKKIGATWHLPAKKSWFIFLCKLEDYQEEIVDKLNKDIKESVNNLDLVFTRRISRVIGDSDF